jgi:hypothetical protein
MFTDVRLILNRQLLGVLILGRFFSELEVIAGNVYR